MPRRLHDGDFPHAAYGVDTSAIPDYVDPFMAYRAWHWTEQGLTSLNGAVWTPGQAFVATCNIYVQSLTRAHDHATLTGDVAPLLEVEEHPVPNEGCTCGMYAGINDQHLEHINYIGKGIHGAVELWGRLYKHTLGWRAQYAYPKYFVIPPDMLPFEMNEIQRRMQVLIAFDVDIYLQIGKEARANCKKVPFWMKDYGYSQQGISHLVEHCQKWYDGSPRMRNLEINDRIAVLGEKGGIGTVIATEKHDDGEYALYQIFGTTVYRKRVKDIKWSDRNWRWETEGRGVTTTLTI